MQPMRPVYAEDLALKIPVTQIEVPPHAEGGHARLSSNHLVAVRQQQRIDQHTPTGQYVRSGF